MLKGAPSSSCVHRISWVPIYEPVAEIEEGPGEPTSTKVFSEKIRLGVRFFFLVPAKMGTPPFMMPWILLLRAMQKDHVKCTERGDYPSDFKHCSTVSTN